MVGYDSITPQPPAIPTRVPPPDPRRALFREVRALLAAQGFHEVLNYSFISDEQARAFGLDPAALVAVANPIAADQNFMRSTLLLGIWKNLQENSKHCDSFRFFEIGMEIHKNPEGLPDEIPHLAAAVYTKHDGEASLFDLKRAAECLLPGAEVWPAAARPYEHPARTAEVVWRGGPVGRLFEFHPRMIAGRAAVLDFNLALVLERRPPTPRYRPIRRVPASAFDLSVIAPCREPVGKLRRELERLAGPALESLVFLRQYSGTPIPEGMKSVSFRLTVAAPDRTLSLDEVGEIRSRIIEGLQAQGHELRL
jgi:phenylalanyl-tRNA synthetase beta chain